MMTQLSAMIFNQLQLQLLAWDYVKRKINNKVLYICCCIWYSTWCWTYLWGWFLFDFFTWIFLAFFCYWPNSFMKGDKGGIFSKAPDWKTLFLLIKIKENPDCPNKQWKCSLQHFHQNMRGYLDQWLEKYCILGGIWAKRGVG